MRSIIFGIRDALNWAVCMAMLLLLSALALGWMLVQWLLTEEDIQLLSGLSLFTIPEPSYSLPQRKPMVLAGLSPAPESRWGTDPDGGDTLFLRVEEEEEPEPTPWPEPDADGCTTLTTLQAHDTVWRRFETADSAYCFRCGACDTIQFRGSTVEGEWGCSACDATDQQLGRLFSSVRPAELPKP